MEKFVISTKKKYRQGCIIREKQWPERNSDQMVRLELVEGEKRKKNIGSKKQKIEEDQMAKRTPIASSDLFKEKGNKIIRRVLIQGDAGIGKTTLCISLSEDWANEKLFQQFEVLLLLPLRHRKVASAGSLSELLKLLHSSRSVCDSVVNYLEEEEGEKVLIIADGWDELGESERVEGSFLYDLLFGELYRFLSVALTSRPSASAPILDNFDRFVEIHGFNKKSIVEYIESEFLHDKKKACRLIEHLDDNPLLESVCSVPLNCVIVIHLWHALEETLPTTMTELYTKITLNVVLRNIQKNKAFEGIMNLPNFESLPGDLKKPWELLCEFAFLAIQRDKIVFSQEELVKICPQGLRLDESILCFGLLQSTESILEIGCGLSFHFLHLTFQEYLAALHLGKQPLKELEVLERHAKFENFDIVARFFFGIYARTNRHESCQVLEPYMSRLIQYDKHLVLYHCAFEAQNELINSKVIECILPFSIETGIHSASSAYDCSAVIYFISTVQESSRTIIQFGNSGIRDKQIRSLANVLASKNGKLQVSMLNLSGNQLTDNNVCDLFHRALPAFQSLQQLNLSRNKIGPESVTVISTALANVAKLNLSHNLLGVSGIKVMEGAICSGLLANLGQLYLQNSFTNDADINGDLLTTFLKALSDHCPQMLTLDLSHNKLGVLGASALGRILSQRKNEISWRNPQLPEGLREQLWLFGIDLDNINLGDKGLIAFIENQEGPCHFSELNLRNNGVCSIGASGLADAVCSGKIVFQHVADTNCNPLKLKLDDNPLGYQGTLDIGRMLGSKYCKVTALYLSRCQLSTTDGGVLQVDTYSPTDVGQCLYLLPTSDTISSLFLDGNSFTGERIHILTGFMHLCPHLHYLSSCYCEITSDDIRWLLCLLMELQSSSCLCNNLNSWNLRNNLIDDSGLSALMDSQSSLFPGLDYRIYVDYNPVSRMVKRKMEEERERCELEETTRINEKRQKEIEGGMMFCTMVFSNGELTTTVNEKETDLQTFVRKVQICTAPSNEKFELIWKDVVAELFRTALDFIATHPSVQLEVVGDQKNTPSHCQGSCQEESLAHSQELQSQWKGVVSVLYQAVMDIMATHSLNFKLKIVQEDAHTHHHQYKGKREDALEGKSLDTKIDQEASHEGYFTMETHTLTVNDLATVQRKVWEGRPKWYNLGLELGLTPGTLDSIKQTNHYDTDECFKATLKEWLSKPELDRSWSKLAKSLNEKTVGFGYLAEEIYLEYGPSNHR